MESSLPGPTYLNLEYIFFQVYRFFASIAGFFGGGAESNIRVSGWDVLRVIATILGILLIVLITYTLIRLIELKKEREEALRAKFAPKFVQPIVDNPNTVRWEKIEHHAISENANDRRLAVIEADTILDEQLRLHGFPGETLGERLLSPAAQNLKTINQAWEAHKIRNKIAHEGSAFIFSKPDARRTIEQYKAVFRELGFLE